MKGNPDVFYLSFRLLPLFHASRRTCCTHRRAPHQRMLLSATHTTRALRLQRILRAPLCTLQLIALRWPPFVHHLDIATLCRVQAGAWQANGAGINW